MSCMKNNQTCNIITIFIITLHQLVDTSQILGELESFYYNRNVHDGYWYWKPNFLPDLHLIWCIDSQISGKEFLIILKKHEWRKEENSLILPLFQENLETYVKQNRCCEVFTIRHDLIYEYFDSQFPSAVCLEACNVASRESLIGQCEHNII